MTIRPKILVALPTFRGVIHVETMLCLMRLKNCPADFDFAYYDSSSAMEARNALASKFLANKALTHILMIDDDMAFRHEAITRMIAAQKDFIGLAYPSRTIDLEKALALAKTEPPNRAIASSLLFNIPVGDMPRPTNGITQVSAIGAAIILISRRTLAEIIKAGVRTKPAHASPGVHGPLYGFFDPIVDGENLVGEDYSFCRRAAAAGIAINAIVDETVAHIGQFTYTGKFSDALT